MILGLGLGPVEPELELDDELELERLRDPDELNLERLLVAASDNSTITTAMDNRNRTVVIRIVLSVIP